MGDMWPKTEKKEAPVDERKDEEGVEEPFDEYHAVPMTRLSAARPTSQIDDNAHPDDDGSDGKEDFAIRDGSDSTEDDIPFDDISE